MLEQEEYKWAINFYSQEEVRSDVIITNIHHFKDEWLTLDKAEGNKTIIVLIPP